MGRADYGVDRACGKAQRAADALGFIDDSHLCRTGGSILVIDGRNPATQQFRNGRSGCITAWRALIDIGIPVDYRNGVRSTPWISALATLRLRQ
jgi:hypothetical protein